MSVSREVPISDASAPFFVGIDLGGTSIKVSVFDNDGRRIRGTETSELTKTWEGPEAGAKRIAEAALKSVKLADLRPDQIRRVGLASPGTMDIPAGKLVDPANLPGWIQFPVRDRVAEHCGIPVSFANDATAAAYAEYWTGAGRIDRDRRTGEAAELPYSMILLTLGTGIGCGLIVNDRPFDGAHSHGGEYGHSIIDYDENARICGCGKPGHFEAYASATAVAKRTYEALIAGRESSVMDRILSLPDVRKFVEDHRKENARIERPAFLCRELVKYEPFYGPIPKIVCEEAGKGDAMSLEIIDRTAMYLGAGTANLMHTIDPDAIFFGGAMLFGGPGTKLGERFLDRIRQEIRTRAYPFLAARTTIGFASFGNDAGQYGAAGIARLEWLAHETA
ncbi:MAG: ROK family protein [Planctomycetia bacterium]|nr:ROK family protein [Planctomycetia bacterium]